MTLRVVPITITDAKKHIERHHSHHHAPLGGLFACAVADGERVVCVAMLSRPIARRLDAIPTVAEVTRVASDGTKHAASKCIAAVTRAALALGYTRLVSYTILGESGASYVAAGWTITALCGGGDGWDSRAGRSVQQTAVKVRWETGPERAEGDGAAAMLCGIWAGRLEVEPRAENLPLLAAMDNRRTGKP